MPTGPADGRVAGTMLTVVLPLAIVLHLVCTLLFYSQQLAVLRDRQEANVIAARDAHKQLAFVRQNSEKQVVAARRLA